MQTNIFSGCDHNKAMQILEGKMFYCVVSVCMANECVCVCMYNVHETGNRKLDGDTAYPFLLLLSVHCYTMPLKFFENSESKLKEIHSLKQNSLKDTG